MNRSVFFVWISTCLLCAVVQSQSVPKQIAEPATAAQAAFVLDLTSFPMVNADTDADAGPKIQFIASQSYPARGTVVDVAKKLQAELLKKGFTEAAGISVTEAYASATYEPLTSPIVRVPSSACYHGHFCVDSNLSIAVLEPHPPSPSPPGYRRRRGEDKV